MKDDLACLESMKSLQKRLEESVVAQVAVRKHREQRLSFAIDELLRRFDDTQELITQGKYTPQDALIFIRRQAVRCVELKDDLLAAPPQGKQGR